MILSFASVTVNPVTRLESHSYTFLAFNSHRITFLRKNHPGGRGVTGRKQIAGTSTGTTSRASKDDGAPNYSDAPSEVNEMREMDNPAFEFYFSFERIVFWFATMVLSVAWFFKIAA